MKNDTYVDASGPVLGEGVEDPADCGFGHLDRAIELGEVTTALGVSGG